LTISIKPDHHHINGILLLSISKKKEKKRNQKGRQKKEGEGIWKKELITKITSWNRRIKITSNNNMQSLSLSRGTEMGIEFK